MQKFTRHDQEMIEIFTDPCKWASHHLGEAPRWYQEDILRHPHNRKVLRCGRRIGKTWTMTAHMLWVAFTCNGGLKQKTGATCIVATPYESQIREIYDQIKTFIDNNDVLKASVKSMTKNPFNVEFHNKSRIKLFTAGTRSGAEGGSLRGQKADWIYMDEVDYMSDKDFETISAIALEAPKRIGIMVASTPTGRRGVFYRLCKENKFNQDELVVAGTDHTYKNHQYDRPSAEGWKEFHFTTMVNPEWDYTMEKDLRSIYTQVAYEHEVLAEFGTETIGVFNKDFIDEAASIAYSLITQPRYDSPCVFGVDWDKFGAATQIVVTQFDPFDTRRTEGNILGNGTGRFKVIQRIEIPISDFTYDIAVRTIIEMDALYNPRFIYADRGSGEMQIEMLRKALGDKVKGIHLGSSHQVRDPHSREFDNKPIKPFMVNQATLLLERGMLRIPHIDIDEVIFRQMTNYQVVRISAKTNEPTYTNKDEHALDAMMLGLLAFIIEMPELAQTIDAIHVARKIASASMRWADPVSEMHQDRGDFSDKESRKAYAKNWDEPGAPPPRKVSVGWTAKAGHGGDAEIGWGKRGGDRNNLPSRGSW